MFEIVRRNYLVVTCGTESWRRGLRVRGGMMMGLYVSLFLSSQRKCDKSLVFLFHYKGQLDQPEELVKEMLGSEYKVSN